MKPSLLLLLLIFLGMRLQAQCPLNDSVYKIEADGIEADIDTMYARMDTLNHYFYPLIRKFNEIRSLRNYDSLNSQLGILIKKGTNALYDLGRLLDTPFMRKNDARSKSDMPSYDLTCFYYRAHKEIEDFKYSLELLDTSMNRVFANDDSLISTIAAVRFLNSYYYMSTSRSLLLARMNNLENELVFLQPYSRYPDDRFKYSIAHADPRPDEWYKKNGDKITTATDAMMEQTRRGPRNWFLKSLAGGATGAAIVVGILALFKWHK
jgi:hypothetical protein